MRELVLTLLFVGVALAAPQGYNYQLNVIPYGNGALTYPQVQAIQQFASQQEQSVTQQQTVRLAAVEVPAPNQHIASAGGNGGSQFANQLIQLASYGQQQQLQQLQPVQPVQLLPQSLPLPQPQLQPQIQQQPLPQVQPLPQQQPQIQQQPQQLPPQQQALPQSQSQFIPQQQAPAPQQSQPQPQVPQPLPQPIPQPEVQQPQQSVQYTSAPLPQVPQVPQPTHYQPAPAPAPAPTHAPQTAYYNKEFYYLAAPQENYVLPADFDEQLRKMRKNLRIVFIKAPEQTGLEKAALQLVKYAQQPQTAIYVLTKQHSAAELAKKLQQQPGAAKEKPEVIFIKYRTRHEAEQAQRTIQSQYEALNGPNHFNFESVVKTENFVSPSAVIEPRAALAQEPVATSSPLDYLPPAQ